MTSARSRRAAGTLGCLAAAALFGGSTPAAKRMLGALGPFFLAGLLYLGAALAVAPFALRQLPTRLSATRGQLTRLVGAVGVGGVAAPVLLLLALQRAPAASVSLWLTLETVATAVLASFVFGEHLDRRAWIANLLAFAAGVLLALPSAGAFVSAALMAGLAALLWGLDNNLTATIDAFTPTQTTMVKGCIAGAFNLAVGLALEKATPSPPAVATALAVGALGYGVSLALYIAGAQALGAARAQTIFAAAPFLGAVGSWLFLHETVDTPTVVGFVVMALAVGLLASERHAHLHAHAPLTHIHGHRHDDGHHDHAHPGLSALIRHTHAHDHPAVEHSHPHAPDLHHRHGHRHRDPP